MRGSAPAKSVVLATFATAVAWAYTPAAGLYQLMSWKQICLRHCRSPFEFFARHQRGGADSWQFGLHHGAYCAACCWGLLAIQLVLGVMSVPLMALVALVILLEKQWRHGETLARASVRPRWPAVFFSCFGLQFTAHDSYTLAVYR